MWYLLSELLGNNAAKVERQKIENLLSSQAVTQAKVLVSIMAARH